MSHIIIVHKQGLKGQLACDSKASAIRYKEALDKRVPVNAIIFSTGISVSNNLSNSL